MNKVIGTNKPGNSELLLSRINIAYGPLFLNKMIYTFWPGGVEVGTLEFNFCRLKSQVTLAKSLPGDLKINLCFIGLL